MPAFVVLLAVALWIAAHTLPFFLDAEHRRTKNAPLLAPTWSVWHLLYVGEAAIALLVLMCGFYFAGLAAFAKPLGVSVAAMTKALATSNYSDPKTLVYFLFPATVLQNVAFFVAPAAAIAGLYRTKLRDIGLPLVPPRRAVVAGLLLGIVFLIGAGLLGAGLEAIAKQFDHVPAVHAMLRYEQTNMVAQMAKSLDKAGLAGLLWGVLAVGIAAPVGEEMLFRGFAQNVLTKRFGAIVGVVGSALLFAAPHTYSPIGLTVIFLMGVGLAHVYRTSGSLWTVIIIHAVNNTTQILAAFYLSGA